MSAMVSYGLDKKEIEKMTTNEKLIELVRSHECLYNKQSPLYKNVIKKTKLWEEIGEKLGMTGKWLQITRTLENVISK